MKEELREYHPNGKLKHYVDYHPTGNKLNEYFFDENGKLHRDNLPAYQQWYESGRIKHIEYANHGQNHNINGPAYVGYGSNGKILRKNYYYRNIWWSIPKLDWTNKIKKI